MDNLVRCSALESQATLSTHDSPLSPFPSPLISRRIQLGPKDRDAVGPSDRHGRLHPDLPLGGSHGPVEPDDVARVALFLASDDSSYVNAEDIAVDGGSIRGVRRSNTWFGARDRGESPFE